jgi:endoglucanase
MRKIMGRSFKWVFPALALAAGAGCDSGGAASTGGPTTAAAALKPCGPDGLIDDAEDNNNKVAVVGGRGGYWYTYGDKIGSTITPAKGGTFTMSPGGANDSKFAAEIKGKVGDADQPPDYLNDGMGFGFVDPKATYDASKYKGITFWAKKTGAGTTGKVRVKVPDINTDPAGKVCTDACFNDFGADIEVTEAWKQYSFAWSDLTQQMGWGSPSPPAITPSKLFGIQWQVNTPGANFDVSVDDVAFLCP